MENSTLNFKKRKYSQHEGSGPARKKIKTVDKLTRGQQSDKVVDVMRNDSALDVKEVSVEMCNAKEQMVEAVKQMDRDACTTNIDASTTDRDMCTTDRTGGTVAEPGMIVGKLKVEATALTNQLGEHVEKLGEQGGKDEECGGVESAVENTDDQAVPEVSRSDRSLSDQDEDSTDMDEDKRAIRDAEKALRSLSGDWDGDDDFFSSLGEDKERKRGKPRSRKDTGEKTGKIVDEGSVIVEPTESTEILVNGKGLCESETNVEDSKPEVSGDDEKESFLVAVPSEDHDSIEASDGASRSDDTVEALLKIEQECACIQFLDGRHTPSPAAPQPNQHTGTSRLAEVQAVDGATEIKIEATISTPDENSSHAAEDFKSDRTSIAAQILRSNPLLYDKLYPEAMRTNSDDVKPLSTGTVTDSGFVFGVDHSCTNDPVTNMGKHNGVSSMFTSDNSLCDTSQVEAAQMEAAVILQEMSSKTDKEAATILQQMSIGKRDGSSGPNQSKPHTFSPHEDGDIGGRMFTFLEGFNRETTPAARPNTLENLHSFHESCLKKGKTICLWFLFLLFFAI